MNGICNECSVLKEKKWCDFHVKYWHQMVHNESSHTSDVAIAECRCNQPERSKREEDCKGLCDNKGVTIPGGWDWHNLSESTLLSMRCSEHCGDTVRDK